MNMDTSGDRSGTEQNKEYLKFVITNSRDSRTWEKQYPLNLNVEDLKMRLEMLSGIEINNMAVQYYADNENIGSLENDEMTLKTMMEPFLTRDEHRLHIIDVRGKGDDFNNLEQVPKLEMSDEEYARRSSTLRQFKMENKLGRFSASGDNTTYDSEDVKLWEILNHLKIGDKVEVTIKGKPVRRGEVAYLGKMHLKPGPWVGVIYEEPLGKNAGSIEGVEYFKCEPNHGAFVRPCDVKLANE